MFLKSGIRFKVTNKASLDIHEQLPVGTYSVGFDDVSRQFYLEIIDDLSIKTKIYGNSERLADRILKTFNDRSAPTGVLLTGEKGSGKTMLAKLISSNAAAQGIATIVVNTNYSGEKFKLFLQHIEQPVVVLFDEFEKVYSESKDQKRMLTLFDGVHPSKKLFLLTCNKKWRLDVNLRNRPGRIYYMLDFYGLDQDFIREYCEDNLQNKDHISKVIAISGVFRAFNFDMLKAMVEEMNRYNETPAEVLEFLNARPQDSDSAKYKVYLEVDGKPVKFEEEIMYWNGNPIKRNVQVNYMDGNTSYNNKKTLFTPNDLEQVDGRDFIFINEKKHRLVLIPEPPIIFNFASLQKSGPVLPDAESEIVTTKEIEINKENEKNKEVTPKEANKKEHAGNLKHDDGGSIEGDEGNDKKVLVAPTTPTSDTSGSVVVV